MVAGGDTDGAAGISTPSAIVRRIFLLRHAERLDHANPGWAANASRPHDSPLSDLGFDQARASGRKLMEMGTHFTQMISSPLVRCVQTAVQVKAAMGVPALPLQIDDSVCEDEHHLRPRMMGTHKKSVAAGERTATAPTTEEAPRGVCQPVLLSPGDLLTIDRHIDVGYRGTVCPVAHDTTTGVELSPLTGLPQRNQDRCRKVAEGMLDMVPEGSTTLIISHGGVVGRIAEALGGNKPKRGDNGGIAYGMFIEFLHEQGQGWREVSRWAPTDEGATQFD